jgi:hypothetical protein
MLYGKAKRRCITLSNDTPDTFDDVHDHGDHESLVEASHLITLSSDLR